MLGQATNMAAQTAAVEAAAAEQFQTSKGGEWEKTREGKQQKLKERR